MATLQIRNSPQYPASPTLVLRVLPPSLLLGIDLLTLTTPQNGTFHGIKNLPSGPHFLYVAETPSHSLRSGFWFFIAASASPPALIIRTWEADSSSLIQCPPGSTIEEEQRTHLPQVWETGLMPYRQSATNDSTSAQSPDIWATLTQHITPFLLTRLLGSSQDWTVTTSSCAPQDRDDIPGLSFDEARAGQERELHPLGIDLKRTWRAGAVGRERTEGAVDRSWALEDLALRLAVEEGKGTGNGEDEGDHGHGKWGASILGQFEISFLLVVTVANYSCLEEWKRILGLVLTCSGAIRRHPAFFAMFLRILHGQLQAADTCVEGGLLDLENDGGELKKLLGGFRRTLARVFTADADADGDEGEGSSSDGDGDDMDEVSGEMKRLEGWLHQTYAWELGGWFVRRGGLVLEDGEVVEMEVEDLDGEDERGEYAPVVVDLEGS